MLPYTELLDKDNSLGDNRGYVLMELVVALPIIIMILAFCGIVAISAFRNYQRQVADNELRTECEIAFRRIAEDAMVSTKILPRTGGYKFERIDTRTGSVSYVNYFINRVGVQNKLVRGNARQPITGDHALAKVDIKKFSIVEDALRQGLYSLELEAISLTTGNSFTLTTKVYLRPKAP